VNKATDGETKLGCVDHDNKKKSSRPSSWAGDGLWLPSTGNGHMDMELSECARSTEGKKRGGTETRLWPRLGKSNQSALDPSCSSKALDDDQRGVWRGP